MFPDNRGGGGGGGVMSEWIGDENYPEEAIDADRAKTYEQALHKIISLEHSAACDELCNFIAIEKIAEIAKNALSKYGY